MLRLLTITILGYLLIPYCPSSSEPVTVTVSSNEAASATQSGSSPTITSTSTVLASQSCPASNGSTFTATNKPLQIDASQIPETALYFEILCDTNHAEGGLVMDMQLISNVVSLSDCLDACALYNFQMKSDHFPDYACRGVS